MPLPLMRNLIRQYCLMTSYSECLFTFHQKTNSGCERNSCEFKILSRSLLNQRVTQAGPALGEANISQQVSIIRPVDPETTRFLHLVILSPYVQSLVWLGK